MNLERCSIITYHVMQIRRRRETTVFGSTDYLLRRSFIGMKMCGGGKGQSHVSPLLTADGISHNQEPSSISNNIIVVGSQLTSTHLRSKMTSIVPTPKVSCIIQIKIVVNPNDREAWLLLFKQCADHVSAEPECAYFIIGEGEAGVFRWTEGWTKDKDWVNEVGTPQTTKSRLTAFRCSSKNHIMSRFSKRLHRW
jgi:quinol monooxygenase YgiN